ncbi:MAG: AgmX/PglI C-terminal domain-containing protein, partial [Deltaproteobacteria bacterium]|nr:AgmX/PglI C-terminal domain-containing protein [Deltaproteobacteria bacterium]MBW2536482.1 AgmX/PglI C-terminal domain-containing protein [Deltaproteobacteria bacterium]
SAEPPLDVAAFDDGDEAGPEAAGPDVRLELEQPYKLGERPVPTTLPLQQADLRQRRRWNDGGLGILAAEQPGPEGHPDPRVRVNVDRAAGGLKAETVQRIARQYHWINVIRCYRLGAYQNQALRGWTYGSFGIRPNGRVQSPRLERSELEHPEVERCLLDSFKKVQFSQSSKSTQVKVSIKVSPGDDPMPPPEDAIEPGDGTLTAEQMLAPVRGALPSFESCYRAGLGYAPELWGRIPLRFHVTAQGRMDEAFDAGGRFPDPRVHQCVLRQARKLGFPKPEGGELRFVVPLRLWTDRADIPR